MVIERVFWSVDELKRTCTYLACPRGGTPYSLYDPMIAQRGEGKRSNFEEEKSTRLGNVLFFSILSAKKMKIDLVPLKILH